MSKIIRFFNYDAALGYYQSRIGQMRQGSVGHDRIRIIAKPVLILSLIKGIKSGHFRYNKFTFDELDSLYKQEFSRYFIEGKQENLTPLCYPFYYLQTDGFWHISWQDKATTKTDAPSTAWIKRNVDYAYIDDELWLLISNETYADRLKEYIVNTKIVQQLLSVDYAAEQTKKSKLKMFLSLLMAI